MATQDSNRQTGITVNAMKALLDAEARKFMNTGVLGTAFRSRIRITATEEKDGIGTATLKIRDDEGLVAYSLVIAVGMFATMGSVSGVGHRRVRITVRWADRNILYDAPDRAPGDIATKIDEFLSPFVAANRYSEAAADEVALAEVLNTDPLVRDHLRVRMGKRFHADGRLMQRIADLIKWRGKPAALEVVERALERRQSGIAA
jgi:hypothetical protein